MIDLSNIRLIGQFVEEIKQSVKYVYIHIYMYVCMYMYINVGHSGSERGN